MDLRIVNQRSVSSAVRIIAESDKTTFEIESGGWEEISRIRFSKNTPYVQVIIRPYFPAFGLNRERYSVSLRIQSECWKIRTRITPNMGTFYAVYVFETS